MILTGGSPKQDGKILSRCHFVYNQLQLPWHRMVQYRGDFELINFDVQTLALRLKNVCYSWMVTYSVSLRPLDWICFIITIIIIIRRRRRRRRSRRRLLHAQSDPTNVYVLIQAHWKQRTYELLCTIQGCW